MISWRSAAETELVHQNRVSPPRKFVDKSHKVSYVMDRGLIVKTTSRRLLDNSLYESQSIELVQHSFDDQVTGKIVPPRIR